MDKICDTYEQHTKFEIVFEVRTLILSRKDQSTDEEENLRQMSLQPGYPAVFPRWNTVSDSKQMQKKNKQAWFRL